ncbi:MAG: DUF1295 domain-containing protein [Candidatus Heimdallarchaeaceae archaeon]
MSEDESAKHTSRIKGIIINSILYLFAIGIAILVGYLLYDYLTHPLLLILVTDIIATLIVYIVSVIFKNTSLYDPYWSFIPIVIAFYWFIMGALEIGFGATQVVVLVIVGMWGLRLTYNWIRGWQGLKHEDWRYTKFRTEKPKLFWFINLTGLQLMPTLVVFLGCMALLPAFTNTIDLENPFYIIGIIITLLAIFIEALADEQQYAFRQKKEQGQLLDTGLWGLSRHPNYFGEISFWWGIYFFGLAADTSYWWTIAGPVAMVILFMVVSIPMMEKRLKKRYPKYEDYQKRVSMIIPWFKKK